MKFKPADFLGFPYTTNSEYLQAALMDKAAEIANAKLEEWLKDAPTVFDSGNVLVPNDNAEMYLEENIWTFVKIRNSCNRKAKLVCIEEIK